MEAVFLKLLNMSITAGWIVLAILALRLILKKAPKGLVSMLWILVAVRLICPISLESVWSLIPSVETVPEDIGMMQEPAIHSGVPLINHTVNPVLHESFAPEPFNSVNPLQVVTWVASHIWVIGVAVMVLYVGISYWRVYRRVRASLPVEKGVRVCDEIGAPFILGVIRPTIYLPSSLAAKDLEYVLAHERAHLKRKDHFWKPLAFALLTVYWFHPLLWVAYLFFSRDIEMACDERVIRDMDLEEKKEYTRTLLSCSLEEKQLPACPLAFGEVGVKGRVKSMKNYRKPSVILAVVAVLVLVLGGIFFLTNPKEVDEELEQALATAIQTEKGKFGISNDKMLFEDHVILDTEKIDDGLVVYAMVYAEAYQLEGMELVRDSSFHMPMAITLKEDWKGYSMEELWFPKDGSFYAESIREKFPRRLWGKVDTQDYIKEQQERCQAEAESMNDRMAEAAHDRDVMHGSLGERTNLKFDYEVAFLGKESLPELYEGSGYYNAGLSSVRYFPVHKVDSYTDLEKFEEKIEDPDALKAENGHFESYMKTAKKYDEAFFEDHTLLLVYCSAGLGGYFGVDSVVSNQVDGTDYLGIYVSSMSAPAHQPTVPTWNWLLFVELEKDDMKADSTMYATDTPADGEIRDYYSYEPLPVTYKTAYVGYIENTGSFSVPDYSSEVNYLPALTIKEHWMLDQYMLKIFESYGLLLDQGYDEVPSLREAVKEYDKDFFKEYYLEMIYIPATSGSYRYEVTGMLAEKENGNPLRLYVQVEQSEQAEAVTMDMAGWMLLVPIRKDQINPYGWIYAVENRSNLEQLLWMQWN